MNLCIGRKIVQLQIQKITHTVPQLHHAPDSSFCRRWQAGFLAHHAVFPEPQRSVKERVGEVPHGGIGGNCFGGGRFVGNVGQLHRIIARVNLSDRSMELIFEAEAVSRGYCVILPSVLGAFCSRISQHHFRVLKEVLVDFIHKVRFALDVGNVGGGDITKLLFTVFSAIIRNVRIARSDFGYLGGVLLPRITGCERDYVANLSRRTVRDVLRGEKPIRFLQRGSVSFLQEENVGYHLCSGVCFESVVGQANRAEQLCALGEVTAHGAVLRVHCIP